MNRSFISEICKLDHNLREAIISGYSTILESASVPSILWHGTDQYSTDISYLDSTKYDDYNNRLNTLTTELATKIPEYSDGIDKFDFPAILLRNVGWKIWNVPDDCIVLANEIRQLQVNAPKHELPTKTNRLKFSKFRFPTTNELGIHFGTKQQAEMFGEPFPFMVSINNPLRLPDLGTWAPELIINELRKLGFAIPPNTKKTAAGMRDLIKRIGYDGVVYKNKAEGFDDSYIAFSNDQIHPLATQP